ncbi:hypothetical protein PLICRDRAFT_117848, partial [Plicaturopsis crispa FD-325 SS-3]
YAWAPSGNRARRHDYFVRGRKYSILPALSLDGILHLDVQPRSYTSVLYNDFVSGLLDTMNPFPQRNSVVVMDNASIHKSQALQDLAFSAIKAWIRSNRDYVRGELTGEAACDPYTMLWNAVFSTVTPEKAEGWFRDSGYIA